MPSTSLLADQLYIDIAEPVELSQWAGIWQVASGQVEVYAIVEQDGHQIGNRCFIRGAETGDLLISVSKPSTKPTCRLIAIGLQQSVLRQMVPDGALSIAPGLEGWIEALSDAVSRVHGRQQGGSLILTGDSARFDGATEIRASRSVVWTKIVNGTALLFGEMSSVLEAGMVTPLTTSGWIAAANEGVEIRGIATAQAVANERWFQWLCTWQTQLQIILANSTQAAESDETRRSQSSTRWSLQVLQATLASPAALLFGRVYSGASASQEPLTAACRAVAEAMGFAIPAQPRRPLHKKGSQLERIVRCCGAPARAVTLHGTWWREELGPLIAFYRDARTPVALLPSRHAHYTCFDPITGNSHHLTEALAERLSSSAYVIYPPLPDRPVRLRDMLGAALSRGRRDLILMLGMGAVGSLLALAVPIATGVLVDEFIPSHLVPQLLASGGVLTLIAVTAVLVRVAQDLAQLRITGRGASGLQPAVVDRTMRLGLDVLKDFTSADLAQRVTVVDAVRHGLSVAVMDGMLSGVFSVTSLLLLLIISPIHALVAALLAIPFMVGAAWASFAQLPSLAITEARSAEAAQLAYQLVDNISQLRAAGAEERAFARWGAVFHEVQMALQQSLRTQNLLAAFSSGYAVIGLGGFFIALSQLRSPSLTLGQMAMMISIYGGFLASSTSFTLGLQKIFLLQPKLARARVLLTMSPEFDTSQIDPGELTGRIEISRISFRYSAGGPVTLDDISLTIEAGEFVAFVGASGSGKSTLVKLLLGFERPLSGGIFYDGQDINRLDIRAVRRQIGTVLQTGRLLPGTLFDNILGVTAGTNEDAWEAARLAGLAEEIEAMPMGMHTLLTDGANVLSGGQAQRLLIARALVGRPRLIFFDEATSALDNISQATVMQSLERMAVTRLVIAHRLSTIRNANRIFVLHAGCLAQVGTYDELSRSPGPFAELIRNQGSEQI